MQAGAESERAEEDPPDPETQEPQPAKLETPTKLASDNAKSEPARQSPIKIQVPKADTPNFRRFLAGLFGVRVEGISGEIEDPPPAEATPADAVTDHSTQVTAPVEPAPEVHAEEVQPAPDPSLESVNTEAASWVRKPPPEAKNLHVTLIMLILVAAVPIVVLTIAGGDLNLLARFAREIFPRNPLAIERTANTFGRQETPTDDPNPAEQFTSDGTRTLGTDFTGARIESVERPSADISMLQIFVPAGVEGTYLAIVSASEGVEYQCVILQPYTDRLYCVGPLLPRASNINLRIFRIDELDGSQELVFETNYTTGEFGPRATPSPVFPVYGGAFISPDRFDRAEIRNEQRSSALLAPLSALLSVLLLIMYGRQLQREHRLNRRMVESHDIGLLHQALATK